MKHMEIECKWDANSPRAFLRAKKVLANLCGPLTPRLLHIQDVYLDDVKRSLAKQGIALRVRNCEGKFETTFKTRTQIKKGKAIRQEETIPLPGIKNISQALHKLEQKKNWKQIKTTGLSVQFVLNNKRTVYVFSYKKSMLEMVLDKVIISVAGRRVTMQEIELELKQGSSKTLDQFAQQFTQQTKFLQATFSKVRTAEMLLKLWKKQQDVK